MTQTLLYIKELFPLLISLASVIVAAMAISISWRIARRQSVFERQVSAYEAFLSAFSSAAGSGDPAAHRALLEAFYRSALYASPQTREYMNKLVCRVFDARTHEDACKLDEHTTALVAHLNEDLRRTWRGNLLPPLRKQRQILRDTPPPIPSTPESPAAVSPQPPDPASP